MDDAITVERRGGPVEAVPGVCGVPARLTGFSSFVIQGITLLISCALTILFFLHIGGYAYYYNVVATTLGNNETMPIADDFNMTYSVNSTTDVQDEAYNLLNRQNQTDVIDAVLESNASSTTSPSYYQGPFEQIQDAQLNLFGVDWDLLAILRALCGVYIVLCVLWLISLVCLLLSIKLEILDLVCINAFFLTIAFILQLVLVIPICALLFYHKEVDTLLYLIAGTAGGLLLCFIFGIFSLVMVSGWYNYIDYMNGREDTCLCTSTLVRLIKRNKRNTRGTNSTDYSIPDATRHANLPYIDETPVQQFSNF